MKVVFVKKLDDNFNLYQSTEGRDFYFAKDISGFYIECNNEGHPIKNAKLYKEIGPNEIITKSN